MRHDSTGNVAAASCRSEQFIHHAVQADDGGSFALIEVAADGLADIDAKLLPIIRLGDNGMAKGAGGETAIRVILDDLKHNFTHRRTVAEVGFRGKWSARQFLPEVNPQQLALFKAV